jgi:hypothetical protein
MPPASNLSSKPEPPAHRDIAARNLSEASDYLSSGAVELVQTHALLAIGHALVDFANDGIEVFPAS